MFTDDSNANAENEGGDSKVALDSRPPHGSKNSNGSSVESSEVELLLMNEEEQEVNLQFKRDARENVAETSDESLVTVQQIAKASMTTKASTEDDKTKSEGVEDFIPCRRTSMLTDSLEEVSAETLEARERQRRIILIGGLVAVTLIVVGVVIWKRRR